MKKLSIITSIMALVFLVCILAVAGNGLAQGHGYKHDGRGFWTNLTDEQREAVEAKMEELRNNNASPEEMHAAIDEMLKEYGIDVPAEDSIGPPPDMGGPGPEGFLKDLTDEQREAVEAKMKELRNNNASPEEMHAAIDEMLKGYGIEPPKGCPGPPGGGPGGPPRGFLEDLTKEQREAVDEKIKEMRNQGATHEEIRAAVDKMIEGYGVESPGNSESQSSETAPAENKLTAGSYPNPFNPATQIAYTLNVSGNVRIKIYNITGQLIRTFDQGYQSAGNYVVSWDGRSESGDITASGVYLYRIEAGSYNITNRMVLLK